MGCFLQCFGLSTKRKRRKTLYKVLAQQDQKYGNYEVLAIAEKSIIPYSEMRDRDQEKEKSVVKSKKKKKVRFNLNVEMYEANPSSYQVLDDNEEEENKETTVESEREGSVVSMIRYPSNHRYYNCSYDHDEEDEIVYEESDIDDDDEFDEGYEWDDDGDDESLENYGDDEVCDENCNQKEDGVENQKTNDAELKSNLSGRERSIHMNSVLSPVENLTQWKAIKAKVTSSKQRRKENVPSEQSTSMLPVVLESSSKFSHCVLESNAIQSKPLLQDIAVDASLSNWLVSPKYNVSSTIRCQ